jgi:hypothetical protein
MEELSNKALAPSLLSLCLDAVADRLISDNAAAGGGVGRTGSSGGCSGGGGLAGFSEDDGGEADEDRLHPQELAEGLPWELLHRLASRLPPVVLESLHHAAHARYPAPLHLCTNSYTLTDNITPIPVPVYLLLLLQFPHLLYHMFLPLRKSCIFIKEELNVMLIISRFRYCSAETTSGLGVQDGERRGVKRSRFCTHSCNKKRVFIILC